MGRYICKSRIGLGTVYRIIVKRQPIKKQAKDLKRSLSKNIYTNGQETCGRMPNSISHQGNAKNAIKVTTDTASHPP